IDNSAPARRDVIVSRITRSIKCYPLIDQESNTRPELDRCRKKCAMLPIWSKFYCLACRTMVNPVLNPPCIGSEFVGKSDPVGATNPSKMRLEDLTYWRDSRLSNNTIILALEPDAKRYKGYGNRHSLHRSI